MLIVQVLLHSGWKNEEIRWFWAKSGKRRASGGKTVIRQERKDSAVRFGGLTAVSNRRFIPVMSDSIRRPQLNRRSSRRLIPESQFQFGGFNSAAWPPFETADLAPRQQHRDFNTTFLGPHINIPLSLSLTTNHHWDWNPNLSQNSLTSL